MALIRAILSDYDPSDPNRLDAARATLDNIKSSAEAEETKTFDPSGSSGVRDGSTSDTESLDPAQSWNGELLSKTNDTCSTSLPEAVNNLSLDYSELKSSNLTGLDYDVGIEDLLTSEKEALLREMFPDVKPFDISFALNKSRGSFARTLDEVLNQVYLQETDDVDGEKLTPPKGIDGFLEQDGLPSRRKGKGKRKRPSELRRISFSPVRLDENLPDSPSRWTVGETEITFISERVKIPRQPVASHYHKANGSVRGTILSLCKTEDVSAQEIRSLDPTIDFEAFDLGRKYPAVPSECRIPLILLTYPSIDSAYELAETIVVGRLGPNPVSAEVTKVPKIVAQYAPLSIDSSSHSMSASATRSTPQHKKPSRPPPFEEVKRKPERIAASTAKRLTPIDYAAARSTAFAQASNAYRISRSKPLMSAAAAVYSSRARGLEASVRAEASSAADALIAGQSSAGHVDLHGVSVNDAVRIAREKVRGWYSEQAEWAREGRIMGGGYKIITGKGTHSERGRAKLGPAILRTLKAEGWRVDEAEDGGVLIVTGKARR